MERRYCTFCHGSYDHAWLPKEKKLKCVNCGTRKIAPPDLKLKYEAKGENDGKTKKKA